MEKKAIPELPLCDSELELIITVTSELGDEMVFKTKAYFDKAKMKELPWLAYKKSSKDYIPIEDIEINIVEYEDGEPIEYRTEKIKPYKTAI